MSRVSISLHSDRAERFREIRDELEEDLGYQPSYAETVGHLMREFDD